MAKSGETYGCKGDVFLEELTFALDQYTGYDKFLLAGDFNMEEDEECFERNLMHTQHGYISAINIECARNEGTCLTAWMGGNRCEV